MLLSKPDDKYCHTKPGGQSDSLMLLWFTDLMNVTEEFGSMNCNFFGYIH